MVIDLPTQRRTPIADGLSKVDKFKLPLRLMFIPGYEGACICETESEFPLAVGEPRLMRLAVALLNSALNNENE